MPFFWFLLGLLLGLALARRVFDVSNEDRWYCTLYDHTGRCVVQQQRDYAVPPASDRDVAP